MVHSSCCHVSILHGRELCGSTMHNIISLELSGTLRSALHSSPCITIHHHSSPFTGLDPYQLMISTPNTVHCLHPFHTQSTKLISNESLHFSPIISLMILYLMLACPTIGSTRQRLMRAGTPTRSPEAGNTPRTVDAPRQALADAATSPTERKRSREADAIPGARLADAAAQKVSKTASGDVPTRAHTSTPPALASTAPAVSPGMRDLSADETTADGATPEPPGVEVGTELRTTPFNYSIPSGMHDSPQVLGASAQALISREAWLNEAANYPQHTLVSPCTTAALARLSDPTACPAGKLLLHP